MGIGTGDGDTALLACFDDTAAAVFAVHARLTGGDRNRTASLLIETFSELAREAPGASPDRHAMVDRAHRTFLHSDPGVTVAAGLDPRAAVVLDLAMVEHRCPAEVATIIGTREAVVVATLEIAQRHVEAVFPGDEADRVFRRGEIWLDDITRRSARAAVAAAALAGPVRTVGRSTHPLRAALAAIRARRNRRRLVLAVTAIVAVVALGTWPSASRPGSGRAGRTVHPAPASTTTTTGTAATTGSSDIAGTAATSGSGFVFDPLPEGYAVLGARTFDPSVTGQPTGSLELWASTDAGRKAGRWMAVLVVPREPTVLPIAPVATSVRITVGNDRALLWTDTDGVRRLTVGRAGHGALDFASFGLSDQDLLALAADTTLSAANQTLYGTRAIAVLGGMRVQLARATSAPTLAAAVFSSPAGSNVSYGSTVSNDVVVVVTTTTEPNDLLATSLLGPGTLTEVDGQPIATGATQEDLFAHTAGGWNSFVRFHDGEHTVTIGGTPSTAVLAAWAATVRLVGGADWQGFLEQRPPVQRPMGAPSPVTSSVGIGGNPVSNGSIWTVEMSDESGGVVSVSEQHIATRSTDPPQFESAAGSVALRPDAEHPVTVLNTPDAPLVVVTFAQDPGAQTVDITTGGAAPVSVPIRRIGEAALWGAALAVDDIVALHVSITDSAGSVITLA